MRFWAEWALAVHRAVWFPFNWVTGLERQGVALPVEFGPAIAFGTERDQPSLRLIKSARADAECITPRRARKAARKRAR